MSKPNKVNKSNYVQGGRLTPDEMARHRMNQERPAGGAQQKEKMVGKTLSERSGERASNRARSEHEE